MTKYQIYLFDIFFFLILSWSAQEFFSTSLFGCTHTHTILYCNFQNECLSPLDMPKLNRFFTGFSKEMYQHADSLNYFLLFINPLKFLNSMIFSSSSIYRLLFIRMFFCILFVIISFYYWCFPIFSFCSHMFSYNQVIVTSFRFEW